MNQSIRHPVEITITVRSEPVEVRCPFCRNLLCKVGDGEGRSVVNLKCRHCGAIVDAHVYHAQSVHRASDREIK